MHKRIYTRLCYRGMVGLLFGSMWPMAGAHTGDHARIKIKSPLLESLDKFQVINTHNITEFIRHVLHIRMGKCTAPDGSTFDLAGLVHLEEQGLLPKPVARKLLHTMINRLAAVSQPYLQDLRHHKAAFIKIIMAWMEQSSHKESVLMEWSSADVDAEIDFLHEQIDSLQVLNTFLLELQEFLSDLVYSCPHSRECYSKHAGR